MTRTGRRARAWLSPLLGALLLLQGTLVPMLERDESTGRAVLESEHSAAACVPGHDHSICIQVGANRSTHATGFRLHLDLLAPTRALHRTVALRPSRAPDLGKHPRGPPLA